MITLFASSMSPEGESSTATLPTLVSYKVETQVAIKHTREMVETVISHPHTQNQINHYEADRQTNNGMGTHRQIGTCMATLGNPAAISKPYILDISTT